MKRSVLILMSICLVLPIMATPLASSFNARPLDHFGYEPGTRTSNPPSILLVLDSDQNLLAMTTTPSTGIHAFDPVCPDIAYAVFSPATEREGASNDDTSYGVPEPSTMLLLASGLAGLIGYGRGRFRK